MPVTYGLHNNQYINQSEANNWTSGAQPVVHPLSEQVAGLAKFGVGVGALALLGRHQFTPQKRGWDYLIHGVRAVEEYSPGRIFRTFQVSHMLSFLEAPAAAYRYFGPEEIARLRATTAGREWLEHVSRVVGRDVSQLQQGFRFEKGQLRVGSTGGEVLLKRAQVIRAPTATGTRFQEGYARSLARGPLPKATKAFGVPISYLDEAGKVKKDIFMLAGGQTRFQAAKRFAFGYGTSLVERFNQLARAPFELPGISDVLKATPGINRLRLDVVPSTGLKTLAKLTGKLGLAATAGYLAYQQLDYEARESELLDNTLLAEGITAAAATLWTRSQMAASKTADFLGLHNFREAQEEIAPRSTELSTLAAFPIMGALAGLSIGYGQNIRNQLRYRNLGLDITKASRAVQAEDAFMRQRIYGKQVSDQVLKGLDKKSIHLIEESTDRQMQGWLGTISKKIARQQERRTIGGTLARMLGAVTPKRLKWLGGLAAGTALIAPFIPGALIPSTRPEELEALYSGEKRVPIRKGRWWEFGRCNAQDNEIITGFGTSQKAKFIKIGDGVVSSEGTIVIVKNVYKRKYQGSMVYITTCLDRNIQTGLTPNHIVPIVKEYNGSYYINKKERVVVESDAKNILPGDFVEVPIPKLKSNCTFLDTLNYLEKFPIFLEEKFVFSAQKNWFSGKLQKSGSYKIPQNIRLDYDFGLLVGYFLAEGNLSFKSGKPSMIETVHALEEKHIRDDVIRIAKEKFDIKGTYRFKKDGPKAKEGCWVVRLCSSILAKLFYGLFFEETYNAEDKKIPLFFLEAAEEFKLGLIEGYQKGDGHIDKNRAYISSSRKQLIDIIKLLLLSLGFYPTLPKKEKLPYIKKDGTNSVKYRIGWKNKKENLDDIQGFLKIDGRLFVRVIEVVEREYAGEVYDFEVDHPDHLYQAGTFLVHNSPYEGTRIDRYQEHFYPRMLARSKEKAMWGENAPSPVKQWYLENFTYELERRHYQDRPYPITGTFGEDIPLIGPLVAATIGQLIKPPKLMHEKEWMREGTGRGTETLLPPLKFKEEVQAGELEKGTPISPYGLKGTVGEQVYRMTEMVGLPGFTMASIKEAITGEADTFAQEMQLESARRIYGAEREYWDMELGGALGTSELMRRLYPHRRRQIELYNPIPNQMPDWLPSAGDRSPDFRTGDPFVKIPLGEERLPGAGYAAKHPELKGVDPSDYPAIHRFAILADVAPYSEKFKEAQIQVRQAIANKQLSKEEIARYKETLQELKSRKTRREFTPYKYRERARTPMEEILAAANEDSKELGENPSWFERTVGTYWETLTHNAETPFEYLTPMSPAHKLVHMRTAVEDYEANQVHGTENAFWQHPIRDFFRPFGQSVAASLGFDDIPSQVQERRDLEEYFDILKYVKYTRLKRMAQVSNDEEAVKEYEDQRRETLFGINPYTFNFSHIFRALPRRDRDYFNSFIEADMEERTKIMEMIPENEQALLMARWKLKDAADMQKAIKQGLLSEEQVEQAEEIQSQLYDEIRTEGFPKNKELWAEYIGTRLPGESYPDWYRRVKLLPEKLEGQALPGADWVGWSPQSSLEDIKLKIVTQEGKNMYDYDLWPDQLRTLARRLQVEELAEDLTEDRLQDPEEIRARVNAVLAANNVQAAHVVINPVAGSKENVVDLRLEEDRYRSSRDEIRRYRNG